MTKIFKIKADAEFEAEDITDAFRKISEYYACLAGDMDEMYECETGLYISGYIQIEACE